MTEITVTNEQDTIIDEVVATLIDGTIATVSIFDRCEKSNSVDRFKEVRLSGHGAGAIAGVVNVGTEEFLMADLKIGNVLTLTILIAAQAKTPTVGATTANKLIGAVKNLLNGDIPSTAQGFYAAEEDDITQRLAWGEPEIDSDSQKGWVFVELPCLVGYITTNKTSH